MADSDAIVVTFTHDGESYNTWIWPHPDGPDSQPTAAVNVRRKDAWVPITLDGGHLWPVETQTGLF